MKNASNSAVSLTRRVVVLTSILLAAFAASLWYAERSPAKESAAAPAALGKIYFGRGSSTFGSTYTSLLAVNADGTDLTTIVAANVPPLFVSEPAWSPDGTRLVYYRDGDIYLFTVATNTHVNLTNSFTTPVERQPSIAVTGKIAYERESKIWTMNADGSAQSAFDAITQPSPVTPAWSPDGSKLAFVSGGNIWVIDASGANQRSVTTHGSVMPNITWSPDRTQFAFSKLETSIAVIGLDGANEQTLTTGQGLGKPAWSNDGTRIAFVRDGTAVVNGVYGIYTMDTAGNNLLPVVTDIRTGGVGRTWSSEPTWQPMPVTPNTVILSGRITNNGASLGGVTVLLTGSATLNTTSNARGEFRFESLSPSGTYTVTPTSTDHIFTPTRRIVSNPGTNRIVDFTGGQTCSTPGCRVNGRLIFVRGTDIFISTADGTNVTNITNGGGINEDPAFSPDGSKVAFRSDRSGDYEIYQMNADGSGVQRLTTAAGTDEYPAYSANGTKIAFVSNRDGNQEIYTMNAADGSSPQRLTNNSVPDVEPTFSPDGTKIAFSRGSSGRPIFTMNATNGSNAVQFSAPPSPFIDMEPAYSPDGSKLVFRRYDGGPFTSVFHIANADGSSVVPLGVSGIVYKPSFSPDGTKVVYTKYLPAFQRYDVEAYPAVGGTVQTLAQNGHHVDWQPLRPAVRRGPFDFDGDGKADVAVFRPSEGMWYILRSSDLGLTQTPFAVTGDLPVPADFDGDSKTDIAIYRPSNSDFWSLSSATGQQVNAHIGQTGDIAMPSDIDADGRSDYVVYRPSNGHWYRVSSTTGVLSDIWFGAAGDKPLIGDFNGDGKADPAIYRPSDGNWWWYSSADGVQRATRWGIAEDIPSPADYDGDGKTDFAVFRPSTGVWYIINSSTGAFTIFPFGLSGDKPVPADYDGDGRADVAVYRPSDGIWYILRSTAGFTGFRWGIASDVPVPNSFIR